MHERNILKLSLSLGLAMMPMVIRRSHFKIWSAIYIANAVTSHIMDRFLVDAKRLKYPVRLAPKIFKINIVYDYFICPLLSVLYCQSSYKSKLLSAIIQGFLFAVPQVAIEYSAERKTKLIKYMNGWTWFHSYLGILAVKLTYRGLLELFKPKSD